MANIFRINSNLPRQNQIESLNDMVLELEGLIAQGKFDINEIDHLYEILGLQRRYSRNVVLGNTLDTFTGWTHIKEETGYSIWKFTPADYASSDLNKLYFDDKIFENRGQALSENVTGFDSVFMFDGDAGSGEPEFIDHTVEAATDGGTEFELMDTVDDFLYLGLDSTFAGLAVEFQTRGSTLDLKVEYFNGGSGDGFRELTVNDNNLDDDTNNFESDGKMSWDIPVDWVTTTINDDNRFWIRISTTDTTTTPVVTPPQAFLIVPADSVPALLALSSTQAFEEDFAWCSFAGSIYATIRNTGSSSFEGDLFITSSSSTTNLENYFVFNHVFTLDYLNSSGQTPFDFTSGVSVSVGDLVYISGVFSLDLADASDSTKVCRGIVGFIFEDSIQLRQTGVATNIPTEGAGDIVAGDTVFLSTSAGKVSRVPGSGAAVFQQIGVAVSNESASKVDILIGIEQNPVTT